jgi:hypothetical protein
MIPIEIFRQQCSNFGEYFADSVRGHLVSRFDSGSDILCGYGDLSRKTHTENFRDGF